VTGQPVRPGRRIAGYVLLGLGALLLADIFFWVIYYRGQYDPDSWLRFYAMLWLGGLLVALGMRLLCRSRIALAFILALVLFAVAVVLAQLPAEPSP
jgi:hypothetical protein